MKVLFIHQSFPAQFLHLFKDLVGRGHTVVAIGQMKPDPGWGIRYIPYTPKLAQQEAQPYTAEFLSGVANGVAVHECCQTLKAEGFEPDIVVGHSGWGEILYIKDVWPHAPLLGYFEFYYRFQGADVGFDPEFPVEPDLALRLRSRNATSLLSLDAVDWGISASSWQRSLYPETYQRRIQVLHEGVDTNVASPDNNAGLWLADGTSLRRGEEIVTFCARSLEPYRGFHIFMRALPRILAARPKARVVVVGGKNISYGRPPEDGDNWCDTLLAELDGQLDLSRIHFLGRVPYPMLLKILQMSSVHCYLTYPFVLSWSFIEALSVGCLTVGSRTPPVEEVITHGENGYLVDFFDVEELANRVIHVLANDGPEQARIRSAARQTAIERYDMQSCCLPRYRATLSLVANGQTPVTEYE